MDNFDVFVNHMDDEIRETLHAQVAPCTEEKFLSEYQKLNFEKYGEHLKI